MKTAELAQTLRPALPSLICPRCGAGFSLNEHSLVCEGGHCFDLSSKGYVNLAPDRDQSAEKYGAALFKSRAEVFARGFYAPILRSVLDALKKRLNGARFTLADVGCGEGYYSRGICETFPEASVFGVDLSRDAVLAAARSSRAPLWLVADLKRLPFRDGALDALLDVLTPADYAEFRRVLKPEGIMIKLLPMSGYLKEIREAVGDMLRSDGVDDTRVLEHLAAHARILEQTEIKRTLPLDLEQSQSFLRMTPMTFTVPEERLSRICISDITIHMMMVVCRFD